MSSSVTVDDSRTARRFEWTITAVRVLAGLTAAACLIGTIFDVIDLVAWVQPHASVPVELDAAYPLPAPTGHNSYSGTPYIADGQDVTATRTEADVTGLTGLTVVMLALAPATWTITAGLIAMYVARAAGSLRGGRPPGASTARTLRRIAAVLGIGSTVAQLMRATADLGLGHVAWNSPVLGDAGDFSGGATTFSLVPLIATIGILAAAAALDRLLAPRAAPRAPTDR